jgi:hypothetical protein
MLKDGIPGATTWLSRLKKCGIGRRRGFDLRGNPV